MEWVALTNATARNPNDPGTMEAPPGGESAAAITGQSPVAPAAPGALRVGSKAASPVAAAVAKKGPVSAAKGPIAAAKPTSASKTTAKGASKSAALDKELLKPAAMAMKKTAAKGKAAATSADKPRDKPKVKPGKAVGRKKVIMSDDDDDMVEEEEEDDDSGSEFQCGELLKRRLRMAVAGLLRPCFELRVMVFVRNSPQSDD